MKVVSQNKKKVVVELSPYELDLIRAGLARERTHRRDQWKKVKPEFPEELLYHVLMKDICEQAYSDTLMAVQVYREWKVLK